MRDRTITETGYGQHRTGEELAPIPGLLLVLSGDITAPAGHPIERPTVLGRSEGADISMADPGVSRMHFTVEPAPGGLLVRDKGSHNGTFLNGARMGADAQMAPYGSIIRLGRTIFLVREDVRPFLSAQSADHAALVGGPSLADVRRKITLVARTNVSVLIEGETGAGKEVVANAIHAASQRTGDFVAVNCAALPQELVESELFGHVRGAFSGSDKPRDGLFKTADKGTLLLDEIGELPLSMQAKLLRALETGQVRRVGDDKPTQVDVRVLAATNRPLGDMVNDGSFRADLLHRIAAMRLYLPPLRKRPEDISILVRHFLGDRFSITAPAMEVLLRQSWLGNVRQLKNATRAAAANAEGAGRDQVRQDDVEAVVDAAPVSQEQNERARYMAALAAAGGNVTQAAKDLGVARSGFYEALRRLKLEPGSFRKG